MLGLRHTLKQQVCQAILGCLKLCILPYTVQQNSPCCCHTLTLEPRLKEIPPHRILPSCSLFGPNHLNWEQFSQTPPCCRLQQSEKWAVGMSLSPTSSDLLKHRRNLPLLLHDPPETLTEVLEKWGDQRHLWARFPGETSQGLSLLSPEICPERGRFPDIHQRCPACSLNATQEREWDRQNKPLLVTVLARRGGHWQPHLEHFSLLSVRRTLLGHCKQLPPDVLPEEAASASSRGAGPLQVLNWRERIRRWVARSVQRTRALPVLWLLLPAPNTLPCFLCLPAMPPHGKLGTAGLPRTAVLAPSHTATE